jgi:hypothetical protein
MRRLIRPASTVVILAALFATLGAVIVEQTTPETIERCHFDDFNDGSQDVCFTVNVKTGQVIVIDSTDTVIS